MGATMPVGNREGVWTNGQGRDFPGSQGGVPNKRLKGISLVCLNVTRRWKVRGQEEWELVAGANL